MSETRKREESVEGRRERIIAALPPADIARLFRNAVEKRPGLITVDSDQCEICGWRTPTRGLVVCRTCRPVLEAEVVRRLDAAILATPEATE